MLDSFLHRKQYTTLTTWITSAIAMGMEELIVREISRAYQSTITIKKIFLHTFFNKYFLVH